MPSSARRKAAPTPAGAARRRSELAAIHTRRRELGWDEDTYRTALHELTGKSSAADLTTDERARVLDRMRELGGGGGKPPTARRPRVSQVDKARALWAELVTLGALRDPSDAALHSFCDRQTGKSRLEWCTPSELNRVIEGLKAWRARIAQP